MTEEEKQWIDGADYEQLLSRWRNAPIGDRIFQGETGQYYGKVMREKRDSVGHAGAVAASKSIGWD